MRAAGDNSLTASAARMMARSCDMNSLAVATAEAARIRSVSVGVTGELCRQVADLQQVGDEHPVTPFRDRQRHLLSSTTCARRVGSCPS